MSKFQTRRSWGRRVSGKETNILMSLTDFKAKMNKSKINKYKINNNNKTKQNLNLMLNMKDINKILAKIESYVWGKNCNI